MPDYEHTPVTVAGKSAVVIGGTSGIGRAIALGFAAEGADVIATSRSEKHVRSTAEKISEHGVDTAKHPCDVTNRESIESLCDRAFSIFGDVNILVNSAGITARSPFEDLTDEEWDAVLDVNLNGSFRACQVFGRAMDSGAIVNISSVASRLSRDDLSPYLASKAGVNGVTRAAARELAPDIRVNAVAPGFVRTPMAAEAYTEGTPARKAIESRTLLDRMAEPKEIIGATVYLASDAASFTTGEILFIDGGFTRNAL